MNITNLIKNALKNEETIAKIGSWILMIVIILFLPIVWSYFLQFLHYFQTNLLEREGIVKYSDCREIINLKNNTWQKYVKTFTCKYSKTISGKIMGGICVHVDMSNSLFSSGNECLTAYVYKKEPEVNCPREFPYLGYDDKCYLIPGNDRVFAVKNSDILETKMLNGKTYYKYSDGWYDAKK